MDSPPLSILNLEVSKVNDFDPNRDEDLKPLAEELVKAYPAKRNATVLLRVDVTLPETAEGEIIINKLDEAIREALKDEDNIEIVDWQRIR